MAAVCALVALGCAVLAARGEIHFPEEQHHETPLHAVRRYCAGVVPRAL
jgi:hypothetical protein